MLVRLVGALGFTLLAAAGQTPPPVPILDGNAIQVVVGSSKLLSPGMVLALYGVNIAAERACGAAKAPYPREMCGVRVLLGDTPAELLYVGSTQVNLRIPAEVPSEGFEPMRICAGDVCSEPLTMQFSTHTAVIALKGAAYVHMPVWIHVDPPTPYRVQYPCWEWPWSFPGSGFEVTRNGRPLDPLPQPPLPEGRSGAPRGCAPNEGSLPLHLLYRFDEPGTYSVRYAARKDGAILYQSDWTDIEIQPYSEAKREELLHSLEAQIQTWDVDTAVASLLAWPDEKALGVLLRAIPANITQCTNSGCLRLAVDEAALAGFDEALLRRNIPRERLVALCPPDGKCR